ncbi:hypothetical protein D9757_007187 [Collybiopsis confluens]|uniref:Uncharacterized protein n=1 Tax=Collybiopsis confluens TaxID=2823264 RepID=A0A8H5HAT6_9AGAR|nr:hypothetical protein D9757_007187 [Collybiopsis confluens]
MAVNIDEDTEFNDALRKHGIIPPREPTPPTPSPPASPTFSDILNDFTPSELAELGQDAPDDETERMIDAYRRQRIADDKAMEKKSRFGRVYPIGRDDYTREVTEASKINEEGDEKEEDIRNIYPTSLDSIPRSDRAFEHIKTLAARYPRTKFVSIVGDKCIPNLPDGRIPMFIIYKKGEIRNQVVAWGADKERRIEELEALFLVTGALHLPEQHATDNKEGSSGEEDEEDLDRSARMRSAATSVNGRTRKNPVSLRIVIRAHHTLSISPAGTKRSAEDTGAGPATRSSKSAKTDGKSTPPTKGKKGGNKKSPAKVLPASQFKSKALPLHVNVTHTPPVAADDETVPATSADPGHLGSITLIPSSFNTGSYGWKGNKRLTVELENDTGTKEKVQVMLTINASVLNSKNAPTEEEEDAEEGENAE